MTIQVWLSGDPGSTNFATTVFQYDTDTGKKRLLYVGLLENPIKNLTENPVYPKKPKPNEDRSEPKLSVGAKLFVHEIDWLIRTFGVTHFVGERFQARGQFLGDTIEAVGLMMGIIISMCQRRRIKFQTTTAGVWKGAITRQGSSLPALYEYGIIYYRKVLAAAGLPASKKDAAGIVHVIDSALIGLWHANREIPWANEALVRMIANQLVKQSIGESSFARLKESLQLTKSPRAQWTLP